MRPPSAWIAIGLLALAAGTAYLPDLGHGFIKDDFGWITTSRVTRPADLVSMLRRSVGFYRPFVAATFAADYALFGPEPYAYGWTNLAVFLVAVGSLMRLAVRLGMSVGVGILVGALWAFNFHGVNMALLWISGRTTLVLTACALAAALAVVARRRRAAGAWTLLALLSKEEAVALPVILGAWTWGLPRSTVGAAGALRFRRLAAELWPLVAALGVYALLRFQTDAYLPWRGPDYYRMTLEPRTIGRNLLEYVDRSSTVALVVVTLACVVGGRWPRVGPRERRVVVLGSIWLIGGFTLTLFLPVRSSLYVVFPSVGAALMAGAIIAPLEADLRTRGRGAVVWLALLLPLLCFPIYRARNVRWRELADLSTAALAAMTTAARDLAEGDGILLLDDRTSRANLAGAFGVAAEEALALVTGRRLRVWIEPPVPHAELAGLRPLERGETRVTLRLQEGRLVREAPGSP